MQVPVTAISAPYPQGCRLYQSTTHTENIPHFVNITVNAENMKVIIAIATRDPIVNHSAR
jgi:hypothetical protein